MHMVAVHTYIKPSPSAAGELLREVTRLYTRAQRAVADCCSTTNTQCHILCELGRSGAMTMSELGTRLLLEKSWVSRAIDKLVAGGLVRRDANPADARSWVVSLTAGGKRRVTVLNETLEDHAEQLLGNLSVHDRVDVQRALLVLLKALREDRNSTCCLTAPERSSAQR